MTTEQMDVPHADTDTLKSFEPLSKLTDQQLILLESKNEIRLFKENQVIIEAGSSDNIAYFLVKGKLELTARDGRSMTIEAGSHSAKNAIAHLQPRQYTVKALTASALLLVDWMILAQFIREAPRILQSTDDDLMEFDNPIDLVLDNFRQDLNNNTVLLPSLPDSALRVNEMINHEDCSTQDVARIISQDPAMAVKIITAANCPLFRGLSSIKTCEEAVSRLGLGTTQRLLRIYALRELFDSKNTSIKAKMQDLWAHCVEVAAIAFVLAKQLKNISPEQAMLAGLIHDVGALPLLKYIESQSFLFQAPRAIDEVVNALKAETGKMLLEKWNWPDELVSVVVNAENWQYEAESNQPDYTDIVIISQLHAAILDKNISNSLPIDATSSYKRFDELMLTQDTSLQIINDAKAEIEEVRGFLAAVS